MFRKFAEEAYHRLRRPFIPLSKPVTVTLYAIVSFSMHIQAYRPVHLDREKLVRLSQLCAGDVFDEVGGSKHSHGRLGVGWLE
jgi:hypothetical protein